MYFFPLAFIAAPVNNGPVSACALLASRLTRRRDCKCSERFAGIVHSGRVRHMMAAAASTVSLQLIFRDLYRGITSAGAALSPLS